MNAHFIHFFVAFLWTYVACSHSQKPTDLKNQEVSHSSGKNFLTMKIDGKEWSADRDVFGSYHFNESLGPGLINMAGVKGEAPHDQPFTINLYNTTGPGEYVVNIAEGAQATLYENVCQLAQLTQTNYVCGGALQKSQMNITIKKATKNPQMVEATFNGTMTCVEGNTLTITEGSFYYHENND